MTHWYEEDENGATQPCSYDRVFGAFEKDRTVQKTVLAQLDAEVSTVFLGIDHNFSHRGPPILYETMIFGGTHDGFQQRYCSRNDAVEGHALVVKRLETGVAP